LKLYQYETCPFCNKVRAFLDYYDIPYTKVEVNPLFKKEIKFSSSKHVPFIMAGNTQVCDSSLIISVIRSCFVGTGTVEETLALYPEVTFTDTKGKERVQRANKYFIMFGDTKQIDERREEREWRQWVDEKLVHTLAPNIYRTPGEALSAMKYISSVGNFSFVERVAAKYGGAVAMFFLGKKLRKRHNLKDDVRESLYDCANQWLKAVGPNRRYLGGSTPNLADLAVYGVLHGIEGQPAFEDLQKNVKILPWYDAMKKEVEEHRGKSLLVDSN
jgi:microsomal prostaglandin-E synthase 2